MPNSNAQHNIISVCFVSFVQNKTYSTKEAQANERTTAAMLSSPQAWLSSTGSLRPRHLARCVIARFVNVGTLTRPLLTKQLQLNRLGLDRQRIAFFSTNTCSRCFQNDSHSSLQDSVHPDLGSVGTHSLHLDIPRHLRRKVITASDAASLVRDNDTICVSGFLSQGMLTQRETWHIVRECSNIDYLCFERVGAPEAVLKALGERYVNTSSPNRLTLLFGGGVGDGNHRGLNHLAKTKEAENIPPMLRRTIGSLYGLLPKISELALSNVIEAWVRMIPFEFLSCSHCMILSPLLF